MSENYVISVGEPPNPVAMMLWGDPSTGLLKCRNTSNTAWNVCGSGNVANLGMVPIGGGTITGPLKGAHGLSPLADPAFTGTALLNGSPLATQTDVNTALQDLKDLIIAQFTTAASSSSSSSSSGGIEYAIGCGVVQDGNPIPMPFYSDGYPANYDEVCGVMAAPADQICYIGSEACHREWFTKIIPNGAGYTVRCYVHTHDGSPKEADDKLGQANFIIICARNLTHKAPQFNYGSL